MIDPALFWLREELRRINPVEWKTGGTNPDDHRWNYIVGGSAAMHLHGIDREPADIDFFADRPLWNKLANEFGWTVLRPHRADPPIAQWNYFGKTIDCWYDWSNRSPHGRHAKSMLPLYLDHRYVYRHGIRCLSLPDLVEMKVGRARTTQHEHKRLKDLRDIKLIERHVAEQIMAADGWGDIDIAHDGSDGFGGVIGNSIRQARDLLRVPENL